MNITLLNTSIVMLTIGIILFVIYITRTITIYYIEKEQEELLANQNNVGLRRKNPIDVIYDYKVSKAYKKMFQEPSIWMGYSDFDPSDSTDKIYVKN